MPNAILNLVTSTVTDLAARLNGQVTGPLSWFDGFWDFVVQNRVRLAREPAWGITGMSRLPWAIVLLVPDEPGGAAFESHLFVDAKDRRPGVTAPWPVSRVVLGSAEPARESAGDRLDRPHDGRLAEELRRRGFAPLVGYWGVRCEARVAHRAARSLEQTQALLAALPEVLPLALALAAGLPA